MADAVLTTCEVCEKDFMASRRGVKYCGKQCREVPVTAKYRQTTKYVDSRWVQALKRMYNITPDDYFGLLFEQGGLCAICRQPEVAKSKNGRVKILSVDHDHVTGKVRGLLCDGCNRCIGHAKESADTLEAAALYIRNYNG